MANLQELVQQTSHLSILFVDDETDVIQSFQTFYKKFFKEVFTATNGQEGLDTFKSNPHIDAIITDITMPILDGETMVQEIKKINPNICVIVITAHTNHETLKPIVDCYLNKPLTMEEIQTSLEVIAKKLSLAKKN